MAPASSRLSVPPDIKSAVPLAKRTRAQSARHVSHNISARCRRPVAHVRVSVAATIASSLFSLGLRMPPIPHGTDIEMNEISRRMMSDTALARASAAPVRDQAPRPGMRMSIACVWSLGLATPEFPSRNSRKIPRISASVSDNSPPIGRSKLSPMCKW